MIYHLKESHEGKSKEGSSSKKDIELILFLSKTLSKAESRYWSTKLEIVELV
jgi:hypothetical protein